MGLLSCNRSPASAAAPPLKPVVHTVVVEGMKFQPESLTVQSGDTVIWANKDLFPHTATSKGHFDSQVIDAAKSWEFKASVRGEFAYVCAYHPTMTAMLRVE